MLPVVMFEPVIERCLVALPAERITFCQQVSTVRFMAVGAGHAGGQGHILELPGAEVAEERVAAVEIAAIEVTEAVAVAAIESSTSSVMLLLTTLPQVPSSSPSTGRANPSRVVYAVVILSPYSLGGGTATGCPDIFC